MAGAFRFDGFELDPEQFALRRDGNRVRIGTRPFDLLHHLVRNRDRVVAKEELLDAVGGSHFVSDSALTTALRSVRSVLGDSGEEQRLIRTVHGRGYQFVGSVDQIGALARPSPVGSRSDTARAPTARGSPGRRRAADRS